MKPELLFANDVKVEDLTSGIKVILNKSKEIIFDEKSKITQTYRENKGKFLDKLYGGTFFFIDDVFIDHRDSSYMGYVMNINTIETMMSKIGVSTGWTSKELKALHMVTTGSYEYVLSSDVVEKRGISLGEVQLYWTWSPFSKNIRYSYRVLLEQGEVIYNKAFDIKKPSVVEKNWFESLKIESNKFIDIIAVMLEDCYEGMEEHKCSLSDMMLVNRIAVEAGVDDIIEMTSFSNVEHLYQKSVLDTVLVNECMGHLSVMQLYQFVVELLQIDVGGNDGYLLKLANNLVWKSLCS